MNTVILFLTVMVDVIVAYQTLMGKCPGIDPVPDFKMDKFLGVWHIQDTFEKSVRCLEWELEQQPGAKEWTINESREDDGHLGLHESHSRGNLTPKENNGSFTLHWDSHVAGKYDFTVFYTDYVNVAGVFSCKDLVIGHRQQGMIMTRSITPDPNYRQLAKDKLPQFGVDIYYFHNVDQSDCEESSNVTTVTPN